MNRFSDAGSTPAVSSPEGRAAKLGLLEVEKYGNPTTVEIVRCVGCSSGSAAARLGCVYCKSNQYPTTVEFVRYVGCSSCFRQSLKREGRAAKLGLLEIEKYGNPTTVETICGRG